MPFWEQRVDNAGIGGVPGVCLVDQRSTSGGGSDVESINYTGAVTSPPTGWTLYSANVSNKAPLNTATEPVIGSLPFLAGFIGAGAAATAFAGHGCTLVSIASGTWTFTITFGGTGTLGPTVKIGVRAWGVNSTVSTSADSFDLSNGGNAKHWVYTSAVTGAATLTLTASSVPQFTFTSPRSFLYLEWTLDVTVGGTNLVANPITISNIQVTCPALTLTRTTAESVGGATDTITRTFSGTRTQAESVGPATDSTTRIYNAMRTQAESVGPATDSVSRVVTFNRTQAESVGPADVTNTRQFIGARTIVFTVGPATDTVTRTANFNRTMVENLTSGGGTTTIIPIFVFD